MVFNFIEGEFVSENHSSFSDQRQLPGVPLIRFIMNQSVETDKTAGCFAAVFRVDSFQLLRVHPNLRLHQTLSADTPAQWLRQRGGGGERGRISI